MYKERIDSQIRHNKGRNLFYTGQDLQLDFLQETISSTRELAECGSTQVSSLIRYTADKVMEEFCRVNQYFSFTGADMDLLRNIYADTFICLNRTSSDSRHAAQTHYTRLRQWLARTNAFTNMPLSNADRFVQPIACAEYSIDLQLKVLRIDLAYIREPVLDIGCGKEARLVRYLRSLGIEAFGMDRFADCDRFLFREDWLRFPFGEQTWGTIVSNLGFSNHFIHHHFRKNGDFVTYAKKYMEILRSLQRGGSFRYAPDLPFVEQYLDNAIYSVSTHALSATQALTTVITRR